MKRIGVKAGRAPSAHDEKRGPILYVEDEADNYSVVELRLGGRYQFLWARSDAEAVALLEEHGGALKAILMDIQLQGSTLDGIELTKAIRDIHPRAPSPLPAVPVLERVPIIFVTGCIGKYTPEELKSCGGNALVGKPIDFRELGMVLEHFVSAGRAHDRTKP
jgi:CheY-like chemotaxis protein